MPGKTYKIQISPDRTLGPIDFERVKALVMKGRILGQELTSEPPFLQWRPFISFPELSDLLLKKMEGDASPESAAAQESPATKTMVQSDRTHTMAESTSDPEPEIEYGIPTLVDLPMIKREENPDLERTKLDLTAPTADPTETEGGTKILSMEKMEQALEPYKPPANLPLPNIGKNIFGKAIKAEDYVTETGKKRLLSRNTAALLAIGIMALVYFTNKQEDDNNPANILPRTHNFPYVEVNVPPRLGNVLDVATSADLAEKGGKLTASETPSAYMIAIKKYFYPAVGKNGNNADAKALLASSYIRISEIVPRDQRFFDTVDKLLFPGPPDTRWTPEYVTAVSEYYQMLNRFDQAQEILDSFLKRVQTPELVYQRARIAYERRELDSSLALISKVIPPEKVAKANPRHLLFYAQMLDQKGQTAAALQTMERLRRESKSNFYGPGLLFHARLLQRNGRPKDARVIMKLLLERPYLLDPVQMAEAFSETSKILESLKEMKRARIFAEAAERFHYDKEAMDDILFRIKSQIPATSAAYKNIVAGRQKEKAKQDDQAQNLYTRALEANRTDPTAFMLLAKLNEERGDISEAVTRYTQAVTNTKPRPVWAYLSLARIYADRYELEQSSANIKMASELKYQLDAVDYLRGVVNLKSRRQDLAEPYFEKALQRKSRLTDLYIELGDMEVEKKEQKLAEFYYSVALRYAPFHPKAMLGVALTRFHLDSPSRAISFLKDKLAMQPNSAAIMSNLAIIYLRSGDQDSGKIYLQNAIRSDSKYAQAFRLLGDLTKDEGDRQTDNYSARRYSYRYALASYEMYCKLAPNDPEGYKATGDLYFDIRDLGAAAKNYHKVLALTNNYPGVRLRLAQISRNGGDGPTAMKLLDQEIKINPRSDAAMVERGNIYMAQKDFTNATRSFTEAARINEKNADALFGLGVVYHLQSSYDNALSLFARVIKLDPLKAEVYWQMGLIYQKQNNRSKAVQAFTNYKGIIREPALINKADEKIKELK